MRFTRDDEPREKSPIQLLEPISKIIPMTLDDTNLIPMLIETTYIEIPNAKDKSETPKKKPKKVHSKAKSAAMETV